MLIKSHITRLSDLGLSKRKLLQQIESHVMHLVQAVAATEFWHVRCLDEATKSQQQQTAAIDLAYQQVTTQVRTAYAQQTTQATQTHERQVAQIEADYQQAIASAQTDYQQVLDQVPAQVRTVLDGAGLSAAAWDNNHWTTWQPFADGAVAPVICIGQLIEKGAWDTLILPALQPFIGGRSVIFKVQGDGRNRAVGGTQAFLTRLLSTIPPGKLRFTFIDPVGLGQNVAPFMHLADYDEQLVTSKAWTEPQHIEQQLANLTEHTENVIQKYLRNQFATIEDYNEKAGEVAEPYRVLVVFDFPTNISETAARRLVSIAQNGPRCGVYAVVLVDINKPLPYGFKLADLEQNATVIAWDGKRFVWQDEDFKDCMLELDAPPPAELFNRIVETVGKATKAADKVEVAFEKMYALFEEQHRKNPEFYPGLPKPIIPDDPTTWWRGNTTHDLVAQLGRAGAKQIQCLELGKGTDHNALLAGRVGSGKSTLLHIMLASLALNYSPDEVELYLIDFKEVEFKTYATHTLPHARVVAIHSEREFSLSVLQRLGDELQRRKELFNAVGPDTNRLDKYRAKSGQPLPRILLVVDEFQEFFAEDDAIASQSGQLLDRLARQGRAFGIHILLGSQTLAGAYSLARSTMGQMAVRISLQCSEADSRLILADDNPAARLLSRPGEAIYNAHDGMVGHNNIFQVAWLTDQERDHYLTQVAALAQQRGYHATPRIFDGNAPAEVERNPQLLNWLTQVQGTPDKVVKTVAWLGEPIAIRDEPVAATFLRQSGSNLLIVSQNEEAVRGIVAVALTNLSVQINKRSNNLQSPISALPSPITVLDFSAADAPHADFFTRLAERLPQILKVVRRRELPELINQLASEAQRRVDGDETGAPPHYLIVYGLHRARDLRQEENLGFSSFSDAPAAPNPTQQFTTLLRDGPEVGIHTLVWCDTVTNLNRTLDRRALREFAMRVAFQMSAEDSANLIETPAASKLGQYRALFYNEEESRQEKFRPYGLPSDEWLAQVITGPKNEVTC